MAAGYAAFASTPDAGFVFGGRTYNRTNAGSQNLRQYASFNFKTEPWTRHEKPPFYTSNSSLWGGKAIYVPDSGPNGLIFILGGLGMRNTDEYKYVPFNIIYFMDPVTDEWYDQVASSPNNQTPLGRHEHCIAGLSGPNGTYDM
ncbi:hypothetical protein F5X68DRAFT_228275 [Plectosphaerella plurivora]|uniref:Kelch repeat protein n=1 Tax=Plectosphaerella plurivora TaxID=936078 RepID=A0A9P8VI19_9PEZI|nr:hypothetical protein F5X68DRAFT_228275 [Plectosphaerella plurivora]